MDEFDKAFYEAYRETRRELLELDAKLSTGPDASSLKRIVDRAEAIEKGWAVFRIEILQELGGCLRRLEAESRSAEPKQAPLGI